MARESSLGEGFYLKAFMKCGKQVHLQDMNRYLLHIWSLLIPGLWMGNPAIAQSPTLTIPAGHSERVHEVKFSKDGRYMLSAASDKTVKYWDLELGRLVYTFHHKYDFSGLWFCNNDMEALVVDYDSAVVYSLQTGRPIRKMEGSNGEAIYSGNSHKLYLHRFFGKTVVRLDVATGIQDKVWETGEVLQLGFDPSMCKIYLWSKTAELKVISLLNDSLLYSAVGYDATFSPSGGFFAHVGRGARKICLYNIYTQKTEVIQTADSARLRRFIFSGDEKKIFLITEDNRLDVYNLTQRGIETVKQYDDWVWDFKISSDNRFYCTRARGSNEIEVRQMESNKLAIRLGKASDTIDDTYLTTDAKYLLITYVHERHMDVFEFSTMKMRRVLADLIETKSILDYEPGHHRLCYTYDEDSRLELLDLSDTTSSFLSLKKMPAISSAGISGDRKYLVTCMDDGWVCVWDNEKMRFLNSFRAGKTTLARKLLTWDSRGMWTIEGSLFDKKEQLFVLWDLETGRKTKEIPITSENSYDIFFNYSMDRILSYQGNFLYLYDTVSGNSPIKIYTGKFDVKRAGFTANQQAVWSVAEDGKVFIYGLEGKKLKTFKSAFEVYNVNTSWDEKYIVLESVWDKEILQVLDAKKGKKVLKFTKTSTTEYAFTKDGNIVLVNEGKVKKYNLKTKKQVWEWNSEATEMYSLSYLSSRNQVIFFNDDSITALLDAETGAVQLILKNQIEPYGGYSLDTAGTFAIYDYSARGYEIWNLNTGILKYRLELDKNESVTDIYPEDNKIIAYRNNELLYFDYAEGKKRLRLVLTDSVNWIAIDPSGHFDGTADVRNQLYYVCDKEIVDLEQFKDLSWEPGLAAKVMGVNSEPITAKSLNEINICNVTPRVFGQKLGDSLFRYWIEPRSGGIGEIQIFVNDKQVRTYTSDQLPLRNGAVELTIRASELDSFFVFGSGNQIKVRATTKAGTMTSRGSNLPLVYPKRAPSNIDLFLVSIGVSQYKGDKLKLNFASRDALDFGLAMAHAARKLLNTDSNDHVHSFFYNTEPGSLNWPSKAKIKRCLDSVAKLASADDIIVLFFAGHGTLYGGKRSLYLLTSECSSFDLGGVESDVAISTDELNIWLRNIKAQKQVLILDACQSGRIVQQLGEMITAREIPADQQRALTSLKEKTGIYILSASASGQSAYETSLFGQGILTYSLLSGIKWKTGLKDNKYLDIGQWFNNAAEGASVLAKEIGGRQDPQILGNASFQVGIVDQQVVDSIRLSPKKRVFRRSQFIQDIDLLNDDLELSSKIDLELSTISKTQWNSVIAFAPDNTLTDAYSIRGQYRIEGVKVIASVSLFKGKKERIVQFEIEGSAESIDILSMRIVEKINSYL